MKAIQVLLVDNHEIVRVGVKAILTTRSEYVVCGEAADGRAAIVQARELSPDLLIVDVGLPTLNGLEVARQISLQNPPSSVLIFTEIDSERIMREALQMGIRGFILKSDPASNLLAAAEALLQGKSYYTSRMTQMMLDIARNQRVGSVLTDREREVVQLIAEGHCSKEIATLLSLSTKTIETHRSNIMRTLRISSTVQLILYAIRNEIVHIPQFQAANSRLAIESDLDLGHEVASRHTGALRLNAIEGTLMPHSALSHCHAATAPTT